MNSNIKNILKEKIIRIKTTKNNILKKILKSVSQNNNIKNKIKIYTNYIINKKQQNNTISTRKHKICLLTGKRAGILKGFSFSRYTVKRLILNNRMVNFKKNNW